MSTIRTSRIILPNGIKLDANLIFNQLNVPTRLYNLHDGIQAQDETIITTPEGNTLYEWFALHFTSQIKLGTNDTAGKYQFAVLSDDGSIFSLDQGSGLKQLINNDGTHPSTLVCAKSTVKMGANTVMPMQMDYFQGPRVTRSRSCCCGARFPTTSTKVANPLPLSTTRPATFRATALALRLQSEPPSAPTGTWIGLLSMRGWKVLGPFQLHLAVVRVHQSLAPIMTAVVSPILSTNLSGPLSNSPKAASIRPRSRSHFADGVPAAFTYDATLNVVYVTGVTSPNQVQIGYCQSTSTTPAPSPTPTSTSTPLRAGVRARLLRQHLEWRRNDSGIILPG